MSTKPIDGSAAGFVASGTASSGSPKDNNQQDSVIKTATSTVSDGAGNTATITAPPSPTGANTTAANTANAVTQFTDPAHQSYFSSLSPEDQARFDSQFKANNAAAGGTDPGAAFDSLAKTFQPSTTRIDNNSDQNQNQIQQYNRDAIVQEGNATTAANQAAQDNYTTQENIVNNEVNTSNAATEEQLAALRAQREQIAAEAERYGQDLQRQRDRAMAIQDNYFANEKENNQAALASQQAADANAIKEMEVANESAHLMAAYQINRLGLVLSTAGVATIERVAQEGARNLAMVKVQAQKDETAIKVQINKVETEHALAIDKVITDAEDKIHKHQDDTLDKIAAIQADITLTKKEQSKYIASLLSGLSTLKVTTQKDVLANIKKNNEDTQVKLKTIQESIDTVTTKAQERLTEDIMTGNWSTMSDIDKANYAAKAGTTVQSINAKVNTLVNGTMLKAIAGYLGEGVSLSPQEENMVTTDIKRYMNQYGLGIQEATQKAMSNFLATNPRYQQMQRNKQELDNLSVSMARAKIDSEYADAAQKRATAKKLEREIKDAPIDNKYKQALIDKIYSDMDISREEQDLKNYDATGSFELSSNQDRLLGADDGEIIPTRLSETTNANGGKECAEYVNDIAGTHLGSSYKSKLAIANKKEGSIGAVAVWQPTNSPKFQKYGHTGIIVGEDGDNWVIKSSNLKGDGKISTDVVPKSKIDGYTDPKLKTSGTANLSTSYLQNWLDRDANPKFLNGVDDTKREVLMRGAENIQKYEIPAKDQVRYLKLMSEGKNSEAAAIREATPKFKAEQATTKAKDAAKGITKLMVNPEILTKERASSLDRQITTFIDSARTAGKTNEDVINALKVAFQESGYSSNYSLVEKPDKTGYQIKIVDKDGNTITKDVSNAK